MELSQESIEKLKSKGIIIENDIKRTNNNINNLVVQIKCINTMMKNPEQSFQFQSTIDETRETLNEIKEFLESLEFEDVIFELCPSCSNDTKISRKGGYCEHCGRWIKPCCLCNMDKVNCSQCPYESQELLDEEIELISGDKLNIAEVETIYNKFLQSRTRDIESYNKMKKEYSLQDFINDLDTMSVDLEIYYNKEDLVKNYYVRDMSDDHLANMLLNLIENRDTLKPLNSEDDIVILNKGLNNEKYVWIKE